MPQEHTNRNLFMKALIYGQPGSGKTTLASTASQHDQMRNVLFLSIEGGLLSVPSNSDVLVEEIRNDLSGGTSATKKIDKMFWALAGKYSENAQPWVKNVNTVVIDSGTELLTLTLEAIMAEEIAGGRNKNLEMSWLQDYGRATTKLKQLYRWFRDLPMNVIVTCLVQNVYEGKGENAPLKSIEPMLTEKLRESVKGYFDHIWYAYRVEGRVNPDGTVVDDTFHLLTRPAAKFFGKTRGQYFSRAVGSKIDNPNMAQLYDLLLETEGKNRND